MIFPVKLQVGDFEGTVRLMVESQEEGVLARRLVSRRVWVAPSILQETSGFGKSCICLCDTMSLGVDAEAIE